MDDWIRGAVNYQVNLRSLAAREPRNAIEAANEQELASSPLSYLARNVSVLAELGITVLHIMPPFPMGKSIRKGIGSPYSVRNYRGVDPEYGSLDDLRSCIGATHRNRLKFLLDMVPNHTSRDHGWIEHNPEYYVRGSSGALVYDADWTDTAKLDYTNPALRQDMIENFDFWLSMLGEDEDGIVQGVDGFRIDMAHLINDRTFWNEALQELRARHPGRELLFMAESYGRDNNLDLLGRGFNAAYDDDFYKVCRNLYGVDASGQTALIESTRAEDQEEFALSHQAYQARGIAGAFERILEEYEEKVGSRPDSPRLVRYTDNHAEGRGVHRFGDGGVLAVNQLIFLAGHTIPFLLTGQEFGAVNRPSIHTRLGTCGKSRRVRQGDIVKEFPGIEFEGNLFARGRLRRRGWYEFYKDLITLRLKNTELTQGSFRLLESGEQCPENKRTVVAFERKHGDRLMRCAVNLGPESRKLAHASLFQYKPLYGAISEGVLPPFTSVVVRCD